MNQRIGIAVTLLLMLVLRCPAQSFEAEQLLLDVEKLSDMKQILQDLKVGYQVLQSGYSAISAVAQGSFSLHKAFLDGLLVANPAVRSYVRVAEIIDIQIKIVSRWQSAWDRWKQDGVLRPEELNALGQAYGSVLAACAEDLDDVTGLVTDGFLRASDAERMQQLDAIYTRMQAKLSLVNRLSNQAGLLSIQRSRAAGDISVLREWFGITP